MPLVALKSVWPALVQDAFAGNIVSALFMAGAAYQVFRFLEEVGVRRWVRWLLTATFAFSVLAGSPAALGDVRLPVPVLVRRDVHGHHRRRPAAGRRRLQQQPVRSAARTAPDS